MKQSHLFTKTRKDAPADEVSKNAEFLIRAGFIQKEMAGVYDFLPLGLRVLNNIQNIIRQEMNTIGGQEMLMTTLQDKDTWEQTGRWSDDSIDVWFKTELKNGGQVGLAPTHEEPITRIMKSHIQSYKDLPFSAYQFQNKFRNELRAKSGIMRGREFIMKDMYSFDMSQEALDVFYEKATEAYQTIFQRIGLGDLTYKTFASGGVFSKYSHEFQTISEVGEDIIYIDENKKIAINKEVFTDEVISDLGLSKDSLVQKKAIEVGNIFKLGTRFSEAFDLTYLNEAGENIPVVMGCYGIGPSRLMGTIVEIFSDERGLVWPEAVAPFRVHLLSVGNSPEVAAACEALYEKLSQTIGKDGRAVEVLYDDRELRPGEKFADADLIGIPWRVVVSEKTLAAGKVEIKTRKIGETQMMTEEEFILKL